MKRKKYITEYPNLLREWDYEKNNKINLYPQNTTSGSNKKAWWKCSKCGHSWQAKILNRKTRGCPLCANRVVVSGINDLATPKSQKNGIMKKTALFYPHK